MTRAIQAETRPAAAAGPLKGRKPAAQTATAAKAKLSGLAARQKSAAKPAASLKPVKKAKSWPILEAALILVLIKIAAGAFYIWNRPGEPTRESRASLGQSLSDGLGLDFTTLAPEAPETVDYLAAALKAAQPTQAHAAQIAQAAPAPAAAMVSALSAGALMVVAQAGAPQVSDSIPLPPGSEALLRPATQIPQPPSGPAAGAGVAPTVPPIPGPDLETLRNIREREQELARREAILNSRASDLGVLETQINQRLQEAQTVRGETESMLQRNEAVLVEQQALAEQQKQEEEASKEARLKHLVAAYGGMKAEQAGNLINSMDDDVAVAILSAMPGGKAGKILAMVNPDKAARLTKAISEKRIDPNLLLEDDEAGAM
jgi:flagellar motility protein MotE (MotC chaperone)